VEKKQFVSERGSKSDQTTHRAKLIEGNLTAPRECRVVNVTVRKLQVIINTVKSESNAILWGEGEG